MENLVDEMYEKLSKVENLANEIYDKLYDMDFWDNSDYKDDMEEDVEILLKDLQLLEKQGNGTLLNAIIMLVLE